MSKAILIPAEATPMVKDITSVRGIMKILKSKDLTHESLGELTVYYLKNSNKNTHKLNKLSRKLKYTKIYGDAVIAGVDEAVELFDLTAAEIRKFTKI